MEYQKEGKINWHTESYLLFSINFVNSIYYLNHSRLINNILLSLKYFYSIKEVITSKGILV